MKSEIRKQYFLNQNELAQSIVFMGFLDFSNISKPLKEIKESWDKEIFNELLKIQPELKLKYDYFWKIFEIAESKKDCYANIFKGKIKLENYPAIFNNSELYVGQQSQRVNLFKSLNVKSEYFLSSMHQFLLINNKKDDSIYKVYFELIKDKIGNFKKQEILKIIDKYNCGKDLSKVSDKINAYFIFKKSKNLYLHVINNMHDLFVESAEAADFFEKKLNDFSRSEKESFQLNYMKR